MSEYKTRIDDIKYRKIYLFADGDLPKYEDIPADWNRIPYENTGVVLEVLKRNGKTKLDYENGPKTIVYQALADGMSFRICDAEDDKFCAHIWLCNQNRSQMRYKLPSKVLKEGGGLVVRVPGGIQNTELVGDKYFMKAYNLVKNR